MEYIKTSVLDIAHFVGIAAVEHLIDEPLIVGRVVARTDLFKPRPVIDKDLFEDVPVPRRFDNHQIAPSEGVGMLGMQRLYHVSPSPSTPHRSSPRHDHLPSPPWSHEDFRAAEK